MVSYFIYAKPSVVPQGRWASFNENIRRGLGALRVSREAQTLGSREASSTQQSSRFGQAAAALMALGKFTSTRTRVRRAYGPRNHGLNVDSLPQSGPELSLRRVWDVLASSLKHLSVERQLRVLKATTAAFVATNGNSDELGVATILESLKRAKQLSEARADSHAIVSAMLLDAVAGGSLGIKQVISNGFSREDLAMLRRDLVAADRLSAPYTFDKIGERRPRLRHLNLRRSKVSPSLSRNVVAPVGTAVKAKQLLSTRVGRFAGMRPVQGRRGLVVLRRCNGGMEEVECDVVIVGGGPAGCTCALYTSRADHTTVMVDKNPATGALAITNTIANYPGVDATMSGEALLERMREQAIAYGTDYRRLQVFLVDVDGDTKTVYTPSATIKAKAIVLATGAMGRKPSFKGEDTYLGQGVSYCATCDGAFYRDSEVVVAGVNREAIEEAEYLTKFASTVHWITAIDPKPDDEHANHLLAHSNVKHWSQTRLLSIDGDESGVTGITLQRRDDDTPQNLPVEGVFIYVAGSQPITDFVEGKVKLKEDGGVLVDEEMATSIPGVFAIGDIRNTPYKQVVVAASDGCIAAMAIDRYLRGSKRVKVDWQHK